MVSGGIVDGPADVAVDPTGGKVYWADNGASEIQRSNLDGTSPEVLVTGLGDPHGVALDVDNGKLYFTGNNGIRRANLDGTGLEDVLGPFGALDPQYMALNLGLSTPVATPFSGATLADRTPPCNGATSTTPSPTH